jgi:tetratricopeptide (TPR) repeat protein
LTFAFLKQRLKFRVSFNKLFKFDNTLDIENKIAMKKYKCILLIFILFNCWAVPLLSQKTKFDGHKIDSLKTYLKNPDRGSSDFSSDTSKVVVLCALAGELRNVDTDTAIVLSNAALKIAERIKWKKGVASAFKNLGSLEKIKGDYDQALNYFNNSLKVYEEMKLMSDPSSVETGKKGMAAILNSIGNVYYEQTDYKKSIDFYLKALKVREELKDTNAIASTLGNIGNVYADQADFPNALDYYFKALKISEAGRNKASMSQWLGNIGVVYSEQTNPKKALEYYLRSLKLKEETGDRKGIATTLGNIGNAYQELGEYEKTLDYYAKALAIDEEIGNTKGVARHHGNLGNVYFKKAILNGKPNAELAEKALDNYLMALKLDSELGEKAGVARHNGNIGSLLLKTGRFKEAEGYLLRAISLGDTIGYLVLVRDANQSLSKLYDTTNRPKPALEYYKKYIAARDSIDNDEKKKKQLHLEAGFEYEKKEAVLKEQQAKAIAVAEEEKKRQRLFTYLVAAVASAAALIALIVLRALRITRKQKKVIENKNDIIEEKNKSIIDSIQYARRIQSSLLPTEKYIVRTLNELTKKEKE